MSELDSQCPEMEDLAAFIDGNLSDDRRREITAHLTQCEDCYLIFSESARFEDDTRQPKVDPIFKTPERTSWFLRVVSLPIAATVFMGIIYGLLIQGQKSFQREPQASDLQQSARSALDLITRDLMQAGFRTPPAVAVIPNDGEANVRISIVSSDSAVPISRPRRCESNPTSPCRSIEESTILRIDGTTFEPEQEELDLTYLQGMHLFAIETEDCNQDGKTGVLPLEITSPPEPAGDSPNDLVFHYAPMPAPFEADHVNAKVHPDCAVIGRFEVTQYRMSTGADSKPILERRRLGEGPNWVRVAYLTDLHFEYVTADPADPNTWIVMVRVTVTSVEPADEQSLIEATDPEVSALLRRTFRTSVTLRNVVHEIERLRNAR